MTQSAPLLALTAALCFSLARIFLKRGFQHSRPLDAVWISVIFTAAFVWVVAIATTPLSALASWNILPFVAAGIFAPGLARLFVYVGIDRVGTARASALSASAPLFAVLLAVLVLGERPSWGLLVGGVCVVAGGVTLSREGPAVREWRRLDLLFPLLGALCFASRDIFSRAGLRSFPHPTLAAVIATMTSMVIVAVFMLRRGGPLRPQRKGLGWLALAGLCEAVATVALWAALSRGAVTLVSPLVHAQPVFTVILAGLFLRDLERLSWRVGVATAAIVTGVVVLVRAGTG